VDPEAQRRLLAYEWPGNIRELQNVLERAMLLAEQDVIGPEHLTPMVRGAAGAATDSPLALPAGEARDAGAPAEVGTDDRLQSLEEIDRRHVLQVLTALRGNRDETSRVLGISRRTLSRMIQRWNLPRRFD
jgi:DNA-binding NtrC family response regulator